MLQVGKIRSDFENSLASRIMETIQKETWQASRTLEKIQITELVFHSYREKTLSKAKRDKGGQKVREHISKGHRLTARLLS